MTMSSVLNAARRRHRHRLLQVFATVILIMALIPSSSSLPASLVSYIDESVVITTTSTTAICKDEPDIKFQIVIQNDQIKNKQ